MEFVITWHGMNSAEIQSFFNSNGFIIVRRLFSKTEVSEMRRKALSLNPDERILDLLSIESMRGYLLDPRILTIAKSLLGGTLVYFGESEVNIGSKGRGFHRDNTDRSDPLAPDWSSKYTLLKIGIYLQNHRSKSGGLDLLSGSHNAFDTDQCRFVPAATQPGDVIFWNMRTSHSGNGIAIFGKHLDPRSIIGKIARRIRFSMIPLPEERVVLFMAFGLDDAHLQRYIRQMCSRTWGILKILNNRHSDSALRHANSLGVNTLNPLDRLLQAPRLLVKESFWQIPY